MYRSIEEENEELKSRWQLEALPVAEGDLPKPGSSAGVFLDVVDSKSKVSARVYRLLNGTVKYQFDSIVGEYGHTRLWP